MHRHVVDKDDGNICHRRLLTMSVIAAASQSPEDGFRNAFTFGIIACTRCRAAKSMVKVFLFLVRRLTVAGKGIAAWYVRCFRQHQCRAHRAAGIDDVGLASHATLCWRDWQHLFFRQIL